MAIEIEIHGSTAEDARYLTFAPALCRIRSSEIGVPVPVTLANETLVDGGGAVVFYSAPGAAAEDTLDLELPADGSAAECWVGGKWEHPSIEDRDCAITASAGGEVQATVPVMVRVRKNAESLLDDERDRFLRAFAKLNDRGLGRFAFFRAMHVSDSDAQAHRGPQFLPWHRAYLLDLERELQAIDPSVSLHYWRWDQPAPYLFNEEFIGVTGDDGMVDFSAGHPLASWMTDDTLGIRRMPHFDTATERASFIWPPPPDPNGQRFLPASQAETLALGDAFAAFAGMEGNPHGWAHVSFDGYISSIPTAAKDPLFFMLHANVDRLWALWQWLNDRIDPDDDLVYTPQDIDGRRRGDTMWPWNGVVGFPRPDFAPGGPLADSLAATAPGPTPTVASMIDFQGRNHPPDRLGFSYDTVPYERG